MFPASVPYPPIPESRKPTDGEADSVKKKRSSSSRQIQAPQQRPLSGAVLGAAIKTVQFVCPVLAMFMCMASYSSEHWVVTNSTDHWGLITSCRPDSADGVNGTVSVVCTYIPPGDSAAYFEAARTFASITMLLSVVLLGHHVFIKMKTCKHQLPAILALLQAVLLIAVLLLVAVNYSDDSRWKDKEPSLGWSYWVALAATVFYVLAAVTLVYRGMQMHTEPDPKAQAAENTRTAKVHPQAQFPCPENGAVGAVGKERSTQCEQEQEHEPQRASSETEGASDASPYSPRRPWTRRLSPISERRSLDTERGSDPPSESVTSELDDVFGHRASVHAVPDIVVTPNSPVTYNSDSDNC